MSKETRFGAAAALLAASVLLSRALGFLREVVLADQIGVSVATDAYRAAFQIPDLMNHFLAAGAMTVAFIPLYVGARERRGADAAARTFSTVLGTMTTVAVVVTGLLWWQAGPLIALQFPRFDPEVQALTVRLTRIVLPAQVFFVAGGILRGLLMAEGSFRAHALAPLLYNAGIIAGGVGLAPVLGVEGFAWGALGGALVGAFLVPLLDVARRVRLRVRFAPFDPVFLRYLLLAAPLALGVTLLTVDEWYDRWFGALLEPGTVALLGYARQLMLVPVAVVGQAVAAAAFPTFSRLWAAGRREELDALVLQTLRTTAGVAVLLGAFVFAFAEPTARFVYQRGAFTLENAHAVTLLLQVFAFAVPFWVLQQIAVRSFYAREDMWRPMFLGTAVAILAIPLYLALGDRFGGPGLAAAGAIAMAVNALATLLLGRRLHGGPALGPLVSTVARATFVAILSAGVAASFSWKEPATLGAFLELAIGGLVFLATAVSGILLLGDEPLREVLRAPIRRLRRR